MLFLSLQPVVQTALPLLGQIRCVLKQKHGDHIFFWSAQEHIQMCEKHEFIIDMTCDTCDDFICSQCAKNRPQGSRMENYNHNRNSKEKRTQEEFE